MRDRKRATRICRGRSEQVSFRACRMPGRRVFRRLAREAEGAPLLREYGVKSSIEGSNPSVSASFTGVDFAIPGPRAGREGARMGRKPVVCERGPSLAPQSPPVHQCFRLAGCRSHPYNARPRGAIAQLGERVVRNDEVGSSILPGSTNFKNKTALYASRRKALFYFGLQRTRSGGSSAPSRRVVVNDDDAYWGRAACRAPGRYDLPRARTAASSDS